VRPKFDRQFTEKVCIRQIGRIMRHAKFFQFLLGEYPAVGVIIKQRNLNVRN